MNRTDLPLAIETHLTSDGVEVGVFSDLTSAWHKPVSGSVIVRLSRMMHDMPATPREKQRNTRPFVLVRDVDVSGTSGAGMVAEGICFSDDVCAMRWRTEHASTAIYDSPADVELIHGHAGATKLVWLKQRAGRWVLPG